VTIGKFVWFITLGVRINRSFLDHATTMKIPERRLA
jgi:hypothetical protein